MCSKVQVTVAEAEAPPGFELPKISAMAGDHNFSAPLNSYALLAILFFPFYSFILWCAEV